MNDGSEGSLKDKTGSMVEGTSPSTWLRRLGYYGLALLFVAAAAVLRWAMPEVLGPTPFLAFYLAWVGAAAFGGLGPGLLAVVASWLCIDLLFDPANDLINFAEPTTVGRLVVLLAGGLAVSLVAERMRRGRIHERMQGRELTRAKQEWERTFDAVPDLIAIIDPRHQILRANRAMAERLGASPEGSIGLTCYHCVHSLDAAPHFCPHDQCLADGREHSAEVYEERLGGYFLVTCTPLYDQQGDLIGTVHVAHDITERKRAEEAMKKANERLRAQAEELKVQTDKLTVANEELSRSERLYRGIGEAIDYGVWVCAPDGRNIYASESFLKMVGITQQQCSDFGWGDTLHPGDSARTIAAWKECARTGGNWDIEHRFRGVDGQWHDVLARGVPIRDENGKITCWAGINLDISRIKKAEEALRESEERLRFALESSHTGAWDLDLVDRTAIRSLEHDRIFGYAELLPQWTYEMFIDHVLPEDRPMVDGAFRRAMENQSDLSFECRIRRTDGQIRWIWAAGRHHPDAAGAPRRMAGIVQDITERKQAEQALRELNATLESKVIERTAELEHRARQLQKLTLELAQTEDRERKRLAEILHDDLQQVLAAAKFHVSLMKNRARQDPSVQATAARVDQMLKEAIEKSRNLSHELSPVALHHGDLAEVLGWLAEQVQTEHGLVVHVHAHGLVGSESEALKTFLYKAARELLFNVVKHARAKEATIRIRRLGRCTCLSVVDHGRGFDPERLRESVGLGLLSIRERVELLGGRMKIRSNKDKGSTFSIIVPDSRTADVPSSPTVRIAPPDIGASEAPGTPARPVRAEAVAPQADRRLRVLLADDHEIVRAGLTSLLGEQGMMQVVGEAANGREAINMAAELQPDVVVMDVSMPLIDGDEATRQIKRHLPDTRVIALSMFADPDAVERMHAAGAEAYILKTAPAEELLAAIRGKAPQA